MTAVRLLAQPLLAHPLLAHQGAADESLSVVLLFAGGWIGWIGWSRVRGRGFTRMPSGVGGVLIAAGVVVAISAAVIPRALFPTPGAGSGSASVSPVAGPRPRSSARLSIGRPANDATVRGPELEVVLDLAGGRIVEGTSRDLTPDAGHIHLSLDGSLVSMTYGLVQVVDLRGVPPGRHTLVAEFVAADHAPFAPRVQAGVTFRTAEDPT